MRASKQGEDFLPFGKRGVCLAEPLFDPTDLGVEPSLFDTQGGDVDGSGVVRVEQLATVGVGLGERPAQALALRCVALLPPDDLCLDLHD